MPCYWGRMIMLTLCLRIGFQVHAARVNEEFYPLGNNAVQSAKNLDVSEEIRLHFQS
jgi:hypothetical protein